MADINYLGSLNEAYMNAMDMYKRKALTVGGNPDYFKTALGELDDAYFRNRYSAARTQQQDIERKNEWDKSYALQEKNADRNYELATKNYNLSASTAATNTALMTQRMNMLQNQYDNSKWQSILKGGMSLLDPTTVISGIQAGEKMKGYIDKWTSGTKETGTPALKNFDVGNTETGTSGYFTQPNINFSFGYANRWDNQTANLATSELGMSKLFSDFSNKMAEYINYGGGGND